MAAVANSGNLKEPLNPGGPDYMPPKTKCDTFKRGALKYGGGAGAIIFLCVWLVQGFMYWGATLGCSVGSVGENTKYQAGETSAFGDGNANMVPLVSELVARTEMSWFGVPYDLHKISEKGMGAGASDGTWSRYWGPIFDSFSYEDIDAAGKTTMYMRRNLLQLGVSHRMGRCDDKAPFIEISEGMNYFTNRWHKLMSMQTGMVLKIYADGKEMAWAKEMSHGSERSITFQGPAMDGDKYGDATIMYENGMFKNRWTINMKPESLLPSWVATGAVMLFATEMEGEIAIQDAIIAEHKAKGNTNMLAALPVVDKAGHMTIPKISLAAPTPDPIPVVTQATDVASGK